jgi:hypothetical protein
MRTLVMLSIVASAGVLAGVSLRVEAAPPLADELHTIRRPDGTLHSWGFRGDSEEVRERVRRGWRVTPGVPTEAQRTAFYVARDGQDSRRKKPRAETALHGSDAVSWGYGPAGVTGHPCPDPTCSVVSREPTAAEVAGFEDRERRRERRERAIRLQAESAAAAALGLDADADRLAAEAQAALR